MNNDLDQPNGTVPPVGSPPRFILCGGGHLSYHLAKLLSEDFAAAVTVILPSASRNQGPRIRALPAATRGDLQVTVAPYLTDTILKDAGIEQASAFGLLDQGDTANVHAALRARELNSKLRIVIRLRDIGIAEKTRDLLGKRRSALCFGDRSTGVHRRRTRPGLQSAGRTSRRHPSTDRRGNSRA